MNIIDAVLSLNPKAELTVEEEDYSKITWRNGTIPISQADIETELTKLTAEYDAQEYARKREAEYPSIAELTVALYDTDDKAAIETKRAAVKAKYPKPA